MIDYALSQDEVVFIEMMVQNNDEYKINALGKLKFKIVSEDKDKILYRIEKPKSRMLIIFASIGLCIGIAIGMGLNNIAIGAGVGLCLGALIGATIDKADEDKRKEFKEAQDNKENKKENNR